MKIIVIMMILAHKLPSNQDQKSNKFSQIKIKTKTRNYYSNSNKITSMEAIRTKKNSNNNKSNSSKSTLNQNQKKRISYTLNTLMKTKKIIRILIKIRYRLGRIGRK